MESEVNELLQAWRICKDGSVKDPKIHENAFSYIENFKQNSPNLLDAGFYLAYQKDSYEVTYFGLQLIMHTIKFRWNNFTPEIKFEIKKQLMGIIINLESNPNAKGPYYVKNCMCLVIIELIKREWPQNWPNLFNDLYEIGGKSFEHKKLIFVIFKYMAEEFIESESTISQLPTQRRKDINQYLIQNMESIFFFYLDTLESSFTTLASNPNDKEANAELIDLTNSCLDSLSNYINWLNISYISARNYSIVNILLMLLNQEKLCKNAAKCLAGLANRRGDVSERKPLLGLFSENVLYQLVNVIKCSIEDPNFRDLVKYLVEILTGMGSQLNYLWNSVEFAVQEKPTSLHIYLEAIYQLLFLENRIYSCEALQTLNVLLQNEFISTDKDIQKILVTLSHALTNSQLLFKFNYMSMIEHFDTEEDFNKFSIKYRNELAKFIRLASQLNYSAYFLNACEWSAKVIAETNRLPANDQTGFDSNSLLYLYWDALLVIWNNLINVLNKNLSHEVGVMNVPIESVKEKLINLLSTSIQANIKNPNYASFNLSFISAILIKTCDLYDENNRDMMLKTIVDKLMNDFIFFQNEMAAFQGPHPFLKFYYNLRRQICAVILTICKSFNKTLVKAFDYFYTKLMELINMPNTTQMEKGIHIQSLVYLSNEFESSAMQSNLINQFLAPILDFFRSNSSHLANIDSFIQFLGFGNPMVMPISADMQAACILNRKLVFFYVNCLLGILKCINFIGASNNQPLSHEQSSLFIQIFEYLIQLLKSFNQLHAPETRVKVNKDVLDMTESAKLLILGLQPHEKHANHQPGTLSVDVIGADNFDKMVMFMFNTYDTLNQVLSLYLTKFKNELLLVELNANSNQFISRLGEAIFTNFNDLPMFRVRSLIRYTLKTCLTVASFDRAMLAKNLLLLQLDRLLLEYFMPSILVRINELNKSYMNMKANEANNLNDQYSGDVVGNRDDQDELLNNQIIEENQFIFLCRDTIDLLRVFLMYKDQNVNQQQQHQSDDQNDMANENDENSEAMLDNSNSKENSVSGAGTSANANPNQISELAIYLLKTSKIVYQSVILCLFDGLHWSDSYSCAKLARLGIALFENFSVTSQPVFDTDSNQFYIYLNQQTSEQIFRSCLTGLQLHGEHLETNGLLFSLTYLIHDKSPYKQALNQIIASINGLNRKLFDDFLHKCAQQANSNNPASLERMKKDMVKKLLQPIVGKSIGQLYKNEIKIRLLEPLNLSSRKKSDDDTINNGEFNICSLFDPSK